MNSVTKVISGGQTGIDCMGLEVARELGIPTGGTAPLGWRTENGPDPSLKDFGLIESDSPDYDVRTEQNILNSDGTVLYGNTKSPGSYLTIRLLKKHDKPYLENPTPVMLSEWIRIYKIGVLNVAGNRASKLSTSEIQRYRLMFQAGIS
jgi:hypothetical protein